MVADCFCCVGTVSEKQSKQKSMKKSKLKHLLQGLKNIQSKYYCEFSEKEVLIIDWAIKLVEKLIRPKKRNWRKTAWRFTESMVSVISKMF